MALHILKICVGIDDVEHLAEAQALRLARQAKAGDVPRLRHLTRNAPRRSAEIVAGGSLYWIIRGFIRVRQRILDIERLENPEGTKRCAFVLDLELIRTQLARRRPHQGWRYLEPADAPPDLPEQASEADELSPELAAELRGLGLL